MGIVEDHKKALLTEPHDCLFKRSLTVYKRNLSIKLEGAARYAGLLLAPAEGFGLRPRPFFTLRAKKVLLEYLFWPIW